MCTVRYGKCLVVCLWGAARGPNGLAVMEDPAPGRALNTICSGYVAYIMTHRDRIVTTSWPHIDHILTSFWPHRDHKRDHKRDTFVTTVVTNRDQSWPIVTTIGVVNNIGVLEISTFFVRPWQRVPEITIVLLESRSSLFSMTQCYFTKAKPGPPLNNFVHWTRGCYGMANVLPIESY
jgi:hypothetical protein